MYLFNFNTKHSFSNYYYLIALSLSIFFAISILYDLFQIHIYRHDDFYYVSQDFYKHIVPSEGRWINYIFYPITTLMSGKLLSLLIMFSFFWFTFITVYRWTKNVYYACLIALLFFQIPSMYDLVMWPAVTAPAFIVLLLSIFFVRRLPIYIYYMLFGILFFGTMSNFYYLLPLLSLSLLTPNNLKENLRLTSLKIIPAWAFGFIVGYAITQFIIYINTGHLMEIATWRNPHYIHTIHDFIQNILRSLNFLERDIKSIFSNSWMISGYLVALFIASNARKIGLFFIPLSIFFLIIIIHYIVVLPVGITISPRTIFATWVGILAIGFFIPSIKEWQVFSLTPIIIIFSFILYQNNHTNLQWYGSITNTHFENLHKESPKSSVLYKGVVLLATDSDIKKRNTLILKQNNVHKDSNMADLDAFIRWAPSAREAGFKSIIRCDGPNGQNDFFDQTTNANLICQEVAKVYAKDKVVPERENAFFNVLGEHDDRLIISFNQSWGKCKDVYQNIMNHNKYDRITKEY